MLTREELPDCPVATTAQLIGNKWKLLILRNLLARPWRLKESDRPLHFQTSVSRIDKFCNRRYNCSVDAILFSSGSFVNPRRREVDKMEQFVTSEKQVHAWNGDDWLRMPNAESNRIARESLKIALMQLLAHQSLDEISISDLVHRAGVSRSAFYRNYTSKDALVADICQQILEEFMDILRAPLHRENRSAWFAELFRSIQKNAVYFEVYLDTHMELTKDSILETVCPSAGIEDHYQLVAREGAFFHILSDWFRNGMKETPDFMGELCNRVIPHGKMGTASN